MADFDYLLTLPGEDRERHWLQERLETLSVREGITLSAAIQRTQPEDMEQAIDCLQTLDGYTVRPDAGSYAALGQYHLHWGTNMPKAAMDFVDLAAVGQKYEDKHPGLFVGSCYVEYPEQFPGEIPKPVYQRGGLLPEDGRWSVKLKLASPAVPEGVWLRLPGEYNGDFDCTVDEALVLDALHIQRWDECDLLEAQCILPEIGDLTRQYDNVADLLHDGTELGIVLEQKGQGMAHFTERFTAALELEGCHDLRLALDVSQNLRCYDWIPFDGPEGYAVQRLRGDNVPEELIHSGDIDLNGYGQHLLDEQGYLPASNDGGYIRRNSKEFHYQFSTPTPEQSGMTMQ